MRYGFNSGRGRVSRATYKKIQSVCDRHGVDFHNPRLPEGDRYWFSCPNRGAPFDAATARACIADLEREGLWPLRLVG